MANQALLDQITAGGPTIANLVAETAGGLVYAALRKAGVTLGPGRTPSPPQMVDALAELRRLTGSLNCDRLFIYAEDTYTFPISVSKPGYTWGKSSSVTADFDAPRPQLITRATFLDAASPDSRYPLDIHTPQTWAAITNRELPDSIPGSLFNDQAYPLSTIYFYGQPRAGSAVEISAWHPVPIYTTEGDTVLLPLQYEDALVLNLACRLAPQFQRQVHPDVRQQARESLMRLESINAPQPVASVGFGCCGSSYNIFSDTT